MAFGEKLQLLRKQSGLSQEQLATQLGVSRQAVSKWELNDSLPDTDKVIQISDIFQVSLDYLLKEGVPKRNEELILTGNHSKKYMLWIGLGLILFSAISYFIVWILAKVYPAPIVNFNPETQLWRVGLDNFIWVHGLENFMLILCLVLIIGICLIVHKQLNKLFKFILVKLKR